MFISEFESFDIFQNMFLESYQEDHINSLLHEITAPLPVPEMCMQEDEMYSLPYRKEIYFGLAGEFKAREERESSKATTEAVGSQQDLEKSEIFSVCYSK